MGSFCFVRIRRVDEIHLTFFPFIFSGGSAGGKIYPPGFLASCQVYSASLFWVWYARSRIVGKVKWSWNFLYGTHGWGKGKKRKKRKRDLEGRTFVLRSKGASSGRMRSLI